MSRARPAALLLLALLATGCAGLRRSVGSFGRDTGFGPAVSLPDDAAALGQSRQAPLKRVAVHVGQSWHRDRVAVVPRRGSYAHGDALDAAVGGGEAHLPLPALRQQRGLKPQARHGIHY